ncbi:phosphoribosylformylglycinamidine synthase subunit PurQ [Candidatus Pacearchaeota archaeon]|nr:phosphoribosylformylglycinamidine synthase subunit PurQ [Candidatus Pacearchaeota archaeon]
MAKPLKVGVIRFPGSNCDFDALRFFQIYGHNPEFIWHKESKTNFSHDLIVLPGGFAFGDRFYEEATGSYNIDPAVMALKSPAMEIVRKYAEKGKPILGICNGFQILTEAGILPGKLEKNISGKFHCNLVKCEITGKSFFHDEEIKGKIVSIPVAHGHGRYVIDEKTCKELNSKGQIFLKYLAEDNPNGSCENIAGVCNDKGNIFGLMPHPERIPKEECFIKAIEKYVKRYN